MPDVDLVIEICGSAGEGTISAGEILSRCMSDIGFEIMSFDSYPAEIRGFGKCVSHTRISSKMIYSPGKYVDILAALNDSHSISQLPNLKETGIVIFDNKSPRYLEEDRSIAGWIEPGMISYGLPISDLAQKAVGNSRGRNMVVLGAISALFDIDNSAMEKTIKERYKKKKKVIIDNNLDSYIVGYEWAKKNIMKVDVNRFGKVKKKNIKTKRVIFSGNEAVAKAALDSDLHLYAGYPITPATKILEILSKKLPEKGGIMLQVEDEISAISNVIGAGFAGKRAMTATSGPGFSLMTEMTGLSIMAEVPAVIVNSQRGGPSTGLPTKTEQSDLEIAVSGGSGDSPRIVLAPMSVEECYSITELAFYLAEKYQTLVVILIDFFLSNSLKNIDVPLSNKKYLNSNIAPDSAKLENYKRYEITESGISPRVIPGTPAGMFFSTGLEHNEMGYPVYESENHRIMTEKRYRKIKSALKEIPVPKWVGAKKDIDIGVLSWGSTAGAAQEAVLKARDDGINAAIMWPLSLSPVHEKEIKKFSESCKTILVPELNYNGQFANLIAPIINRKTERLNMVTGLPMPSEDIYEKIKSMKY